MIAELFRAICRSSPTLKKYLWKRWYEFQANYYTNTDWSFMNYGYAFLNSDQPKLILRKDDERNRYAIQLYHLKGMQLLEKIDITANVVEALRSDHDRKLDHIQRSSPKLMINPFKEYAGLKGTKIFNNFQNREVQYLFFMMKKT